MNYLGKRKTFAILKASQFEIDEETETETEILRLCVDNPLTAQEKIIYKSVRDE